MNEYDKPMPIVTDLNRPHWEAAKEHRFVIQKCSDCGHVWFPPMSICNVCLSDRIEWVDSKGTGKVHSFIVYHQAWLPGWLKVTPYNVAIIELDEGPRFVNNIVGIENDDIQVDMPVRVVFEDVTSDTTIPRFTPLTA